MRHLPDVARLHEVPRIRAMARPGGRFAPARVIAVIALLIGSMVSACDMANLERPVPSTEVAARTSIPSPRPARTAAAPSVASTNPIETPPTSIEPGPSVEASPPPTGAPATTPEPAPPVLTGLIPGSVDRSSLELTATYTVHAALSVDSGVLDVDTVIVARNDAREPIDRLELNTIAARLGGIKVTAATVDGTPVKVRVRDQTLRVPLGGLLADGVTTTVRIAYRARLRDSTAGSDWMFSRAGETFALYRWIPWISRELPFEHPEEAEPFVTPSSPRVDVELLTDLPMVLASPVAEIAQYEAGAGRDWLFTAHDVRDVALVLAPSFHVANGKVDGVPVRAYARSGPDAAERLLAAASQALGDEAALLGVTYPYPILAVVETQGGEGLESPGMIWIPRNLDSLNRTYIVHRQVAHQWFYGLVGNDQREDPFLDEAAADLLARSVLGTFRATRCSRTALDGPINRYSGRCYYEVIYVQGGLLLDDLRGTMGSKAFWKALAGFVEANRNRLVDTKDLLEALRHGTRVNLLPTLRARFPSLY
jgi:hypothetical protein